MNLLGPPASPPPGGVSYLGGANMLPDNQTQIKQGTAFNEASMKALSQNFKDDLAKNYGGIKGSDAALASMGGASDAAASKATENYQLKMVEATTRAQLHASYMNVLWDQYSLNRKKDQWGMIGAGLGAAGTVASSLFGGPSKSPEVGGGIEEMMKLAGSKSSTKRGQGPDAGNEISGPALEE